MADDDLRSYRKTLPESEEECQRLHRAVSRSEKMWLIVGPLVALRESRGAIKWGAGTFFAVLAAANSPDVAAILQSLMGIFTGGASK